MFEKPKSSLEEFDLNLGEMNVLVPPSPADCTGKRQTLSFLMSGLSPQLAEREKASIIPW